MRRGYGAAWILLLSATAAAQDSLVSIGDEAYLSQFTPQGPITYIKYPVLGCPSLVNPGGAGRIVVKLPPQSATPDFAVTILSTGDEIPQTYDLPVTAVAYLAGVGCYELTVGVPAEVAPDTYDLQVVSLAASVSDLQPNCVGVVDPAEAWTFVVIADTQFNDPRGWSGDMDAGPNDYNPQTIVAQVKQELRALDPTFVLICGDLGFGWNYNTEYAGIWETWADLGVPVFMVPGNHDGQACIVQRSFLGIVSPVRDGFNYWRRFLGPLYYSFEFGGVHFQGVNSFDGPAARRDGFRIVVENYGGDLYPEQMAWIQDDLAAAEGAVVPFMHHPPFGPYKPNQTFGMTAWVLNRIMEYLIDGSLDDFGDQGWNTQATGQWLIDQYAAAGIPLAFVGHDHKDALNMIGGIPYVRITSTSSFGATPWGYRIVQVQGGVVQSYLYSAAYPSAPAGNLHVEAQGANDGTSDEEAFEITTGLPQAHDLTLEVTIAADDAGYEVAGGAIVAQEDLGDDVTRLWIEAPVPAAASLNSPVTVTVTVEGATEPPPPPPPPPPAPLYPACAGTGTASAPASGPVTLGQMLIVLAAMAVLRFWRR